MAYILVIQDTLTDRGEHERIIFESGTPLAIALIDPSVPDFTLGWAVSRSYRIANLLEGWLSILLPGYDSQAREMTLEFYIREHFNTRTLSAPVSPGDIITQIGREVRGPEDEVTFLLLNTESNVFEISIDRGVPVQCACTLREVRLKPLIRFFRAYHANWKVREDASLSEQIFSRRDQFAEGTNFLDPVPVFS